MKKYLFTLILIFLLIPFKVGGEGESVVDKAGLFSESERNELEKKIAEIESEYDLSVVVMTDNEYYLGEIRLWAADFYDYGSYKKDGIIFAINMANREYAIVSSGESQNVFDADRIDELLDLVLDDMKYESYYKATNRFLDETALILQNPNRLSSGDLGMIAMSSLLGGTAVTGAFVFVVLSNMKIKGKKRAASDYIKPHSLNISNSRDLYLYSHVTRTKIERSSSSSSGSFRGSSGASHTGGSRHF